MAISSVTVRGSIATYEHAHNIFIQAMRPGGILHECVEKGPFEVLLVPRQISLRAYGLDIYLASTPTAPVPADAVEASKDSFDESASSENAMASNADANGGSFSLDSSHHTCVKQKLRCLTNSQLSAVQKALCEFRAFHLIHFDTDANSRFTTAKGQRGEFSDTLDTVKRYGRLGEVEVLAESNPLLPLTDTSVGCYHPLKLQVFFIEQPLMDEQELSQLCQRLRQILYLESATSQKHGTAAPLQPIDDVIVEPHKPCMMPANQTQSNFTQVSKSSLGFDDVTVEDDPTPYVSIRPDQPKLDKRNEPAHFLTHHYSKENIQGYRQIVAADNEIFYNEFQSLITSLSCYGLAQLVSDFIAHAQRKHVLFTHNRAFTLFMRTVASEVQKKSFLAGNERRRTIFLEGVEKYVTSKLYFSMFNVSVEETKLNDLLQVRLRLMNALTATELEALEEVEQHHLWGQAMFELEGMNFFKSPREKLRCGIRASELLGLAVGDILLANQNSAKHPLGTVDESSGSTILRRPSLLQEKSVVRDHTSRSAFGADEFLPCFMLLVLRAQPYNFHQNVSYIEKFRTPSLCSQEESYVLANLISSIEFWMNCNDKGYFNLPPQNPFSPTAATIFPTPDPSIVSHDNPSPAGSGIFSSVRQTAFSLCPKSAQQESPALLPSPVTSDASNTNSIMDALWGSSELPDTPCNASPPATAAAAAAATVESHTLVSRSTTPLLQPSQFLEDAPAHQAASSGATNIASSPIAFETSSAREVEPDTIHDLLVVQNKSFEELTLKEMRAIIEEARQMARQQQPQREGGV